MYDEEVSSMPHRGEFRAIRIATAGEQVADALRDAIAESAWQEGQRLPVESELAAQLGVSRGTLRNALRQLADEGLVVARSGAGAGTYVGRRRSSPSRRTLGHIIRARRLIEIPAAADAVRRVDPAELEEIERRRRLACTGAARFEAHRDFHEALLASVPEQVWREAAHPLFVWLGEHIDREAAPERTWISVDCDHRRIIEAVCSRSESIACQAMSDHLDHLGDCYASLTDR